MNQLARNNYLHLFFDNEDITQRTGFYIASMQKSKNFNVGLNRNINTIQGALNKKLFLGTTNDNFEFEVTLVKARKINGYLRAKEIHEEDIEELYRYIVRNEPKAIEKDDKLYYGIFTTAEGYNTINNNGYITFKFIMTEPYIYSKEEVRAFNTAISNEVELRNGTDLIDEKTFIDIEFNSGDNTSIKFTNYKNDSFIELNSLTKNNNYKIYGEEMQIINLDNPKEIIYSPTFIHLDYHPNIIKIESENSISGAIKYQIKYGIK